MKRVAFTKRRQLQKLVNLPLVYLGVIILCIHHIFKLYQSNYLLFTSLVLTVIGIIGHTMNDKHQSRY